MLYAEMDCPRVVCSVCCREVPRNQASYWYSWWNDICRTLDWESPSNPDHSHQLWCNRMKTFMDFEHLLQRLPFSFAPMTTASDFSRVKLEQLLSHLGVFQQGLWKYEFCPQFCLMSPGADLFLFSELWTATTMDVEDFPPANWSPSSSSTSYEDALIRAYVSPPLAVIMSLSPLFDSPAPDLQEPTLVNVNLRDWMDYYKWRGLCSFEEQVLSNPLALLLHWPLTLYHIVAHKLPSLNPFCIPKILINRKLIIHLIGVEKELSLLPIFKELDYLFKSQIRIHIYFIGRHFDATADKTVYHLSSRLSISAWSGLYHEFLYARKMTGETPDLIVGFNAGLAAYSTWPASLSAIAEMGVPAFFTDSCLYSSLWGFQVTNSLGLGPNQPDSIVGDDYKPGDVGSRSCITMNPFRSPIRIESPGLRWGWFSNAFIFSPFYPLDYLQQRSDLPLRMASLSV
ncbi:unnamed protein product [Trichobilharzia szidati]|nr:unnamed protein product [Trichobilharzia szidati]